MKQELFEYHIKSAGAKEQTLWASEHSFKPRPAMGECLILFNRDGDQVATFRADDLLYFTRYRRTIAKGCSRCGKSIEGGSLCEECLNDFEEESTGRLYRSEEHARAEREFIEGTNELVENQMEKLKEKSEKDRDLVRKNMEEEEEINKKGLPDSKAHEAHKKLEEWQNGLIKRRAANERKKLTTTILRKQREKEDQTEKIQIDKEEARRPFLGANSHGVTWPERRNASVLCEGVGAPEEENVDQGVEIL